MPVFRTQSQVYDRCVAEGHLRKTEELNIGKLESNLKIALEDQTSAKELLKKKHWNSAYKLYYDVLRILVESLLMLDNIKSSNHQCLFACLCTRHPELELSWEFFEKVRTKRNGIHYYSEPVLRDDWKGIELQMNLYIELLKKQLRHKINTCRD